MNSMSFSAGQAPEIAIRMVIIAAGKHNDGLSVFQC